jgi:hypothetical protein
MQSDDEREMCARTIYCTNIDKKVCYHIIMISLVISFCYVCILIYPLTAGHSGRSEIVF